MDRPKIIYKYESFSAQSLQNLKAQSVYFGSPLGFNDPYDCALYAGAKDPTEQELVQLKAQYSSRPDVPEEIQNQFKTASLLELREIVLKGVVSTLESHAESFLEKRGVSCFTERNDDLLMWSHYGGRYKGFCLGFSTDYEPFKGIRKVKYTDSMPKVNAVNILLKDDFDEMLDLFCTKSKSWSYEKEWRNFHQQAGTLFTYETPALKSVFFGPDIDRQSMEIICLILAGQNPDVELWQGKRSKEKFEVVFTRFTYTSYKDAKDRGLIS